MSLNYQIATFRLLIDKGIWVEVSIKGCDHEKETVTPEQLKDAARTIERVGRAVRKIQNTIDHERGREAHLKATA